VITVVGLSHRSAPIEIREQVAFPHDQVPQLLQECVAQPDIAEAMLLSTCNRVEIFAAGPPELGTDLARVARASQQVLQERAPGVAPYTYQHLAAEAVRHVFRVAASLDSMVLGEPQILGQLKCAFDVARDAGTLGTRLHRTIPRAIRAAKRVRSETALGRGQVSMPGVAMDLAKRIFGELSGSTAVLIGSGEIADAVARLLAAEHARLLVVGRDSVRVAQIADRVGGVPRHLRDLDSVLAEADVVVSSTSAPGFVVSLESVARLHRARRGRSLFFIDLAVPRDVDPRIGDLDRMFVYNVDDFAKIVEEAYSTRRREAKLAERIVAAEAEGFDRWLDASEQVTPAIVALRSQFDRVLSEEIDRTLKGRLRHLGSEERAALDKLREAAVNKLLHGPTVRLRDGFSVGRRGPQHRAAPGGPGRSVRGRTRVVPEQPARFAARQPGAADADSQGAQWRGARVGSVRRRRDPRC